MSNAENFLQVYNMKIPFPEKMNNEDSKKYARALVLQRQLSLTLAEISRIERKCKNTI